MEAEKCIRLCNALANQYAGIDYYISADVLLISGHSIATNVNAVCSLDTRGDQRMGKFCGRMLIMFKVWSECCNYKMVPNGNTEESCDYSVKHRHRDNKHVI